VSNTKKRKIIDKTRYMKLPKSTLVDIIIHRCKELSAVRATIENERIDCTRMAECARDAALKVELAEGTTRDLKRELSENRELLRVMVRLVNSSCL